jgi:hypothetical protein
VPAMIYVARQAGKTIVGTFNVPPTTNALFPVLSRGQMDLNPDLKSRRFTRIRRERDRLRTIAGNAKGPGRAF